MSVVILGAGSWGTAMAIHLARLRQDVLLWGRDSAQVQKMQNTRENQPYLPGVMFPESLNITDSLQTALQDPKTKYIILAVPSHAFREILLQIKNYYSDHIKNKIFMGLTKGLDTKTHQLLHEVVQEILGKNSTYAVLSGPGFAKEVALNLPTAVTLACAEKNTGKKLIQLFHAPNFRVYLSSDISGVELGGAVKNVLAIAVGMAEGLTCGANAQAALMTRGLSEMMRLGHALGASAETFMGLSGVGDLILTCTNNQSRNRYFGVLIGQGVEKEKALQNIGQVVEGLQTAQEIWALSKKYQIDMPITEQVYQVLYQQLSPQKALENLLAREPKIESI